MLLVLPVVVETFFFFFSPPPPFFYEPLEWGCGVGEGGEGREGGGQLTFRLSGLERKGLRSLTESRELLLLLRRLGYGTPAHAQNQRTGLKGSCLHPARPRTFFCFLVLLTFEGAGRGASRTNCPWPPSVLSTGFTIQFGSLVPHLCVLIIAGRGGIREFNVKTVKLKKKKKSTHRKETHTVVRGC